MKGAKAKKAKEVKKAKFIFIKSKDAYRSRTIFIVYHESRHSIYALSIR
jgi:hypothetical protein